MSRLNLKVAADGDSTGEHAQKQTGTEDNQEHLPKIAAKVLLEINIGSKGQNFRRNEVNYRIKNSQSDNAGQ